MFDIGKDLQRAYEEGYKQGKFDGQVELEQKILNAGIEGKEHRFYFEGRLFAVRELPQ